MKARLTRFSNRLCVGLASIGLLAVGTATTASAGTITFDPADGYELGKSLVVSPDWAGNGSLYTITSLGGGNGAAQVVPTVTGSAFANNRFVPDAAFLGDTDTTTAGKVYDFSFDLKFDGLGLNDQGENAGFRLDHRIGIGGSDGAPLVSFQLFANGRLQYNDNGGFNNVVNTNGNTVGSISDFGDRFVTVEGRIDIDADSYDLIVDGVTQGTGLGLFANPVPSDFGQITLQWRTNDAPALQYSLDNLSVAIPEPGTLALAGLGTVGLLMRRRSA